MNRRKKTTSVIATVTAAAIALSGTFAWSSIAQMAKNEAQGTLNPGVRLHDDYSGWNTATKSGLTKDIYVENYSDVTVYARVRLDEFMEIGTGAGTKDGQPNNSTAKSLVSGSDIDAVGTWKTHIPGVSDLDDGTKETYEYNDESKTFHRYWDWTFGGEDPDNTDGSTIYMPTANKNKDSLTADINGSMETDKNGNILRKADGTFNNYVEYKAGDVSTGRDTYYDANDAVVGKGNPSDNSAAMSGEDYKITKETYTAKETAKIPTSQNGVGVITMQNYIDNYLDKGETSYVGWVYDTDGWAYWSQPLLPGETTSLLLDSIKLKESPEDSWYYAINAVGQFATKDDLGVFSDKNNGNPATDNAVKLLETISKGTIVKKDDQEDQSHLTIGGRSVKNGERLTVTPGAYKLAAYGSDGTEWNLSNCEVTVSGSKQARYREDGYVVIDGDCKSAEITVTVSKVSNGISNAVSLNSAANTLNAVLIVGGDGASSTVQIGESGDSIPSGGSTTMNKGETLPITTKDKTGAGTTVEGLTGDSSVVPTYIHLDEDKKNIVVEENCPSGKYEVTVEDSNGNKTTFTINVPNKPFEVEIDGTTYTQDSIPQQTVKSSDLPMSVAPKNGSATDYTYSVTPASKGIGVDKNGNVTVTDEAAIDPNTVYEVTITDKNGNTVKVPFTVSNANVDMTDENGEKLNNPTNLGAGESVKISQNKNNGWTVTANPSSAVTIADDGTIKASDTLEGDATVTITSTKNGSTASLTLNVTGKGKVTFTNGGNASIATNGRGSYALTRSNAVKSSSLTVTKADSNSIVESAEIGTGNALSVKLNSGVKNGATETLTIKDGSTTVGTFKVTATNTYIAKLLNTSTDTAFTSNPELKVGDNSTNVTVKPVLYGSDSVEVSDGTWSASGSTNYVAVKDNNDGTWTLSGLAATTSAETVTFKNDTAGKKLELTVVVSASVKEELSERESAQLSYCGLYGDGLVTCEDSLDGVDVGDCDLECYVHFDKNDADKFGNLRNGNLYVRAGTVFYVFDNDDGDRVIRFDGCKLENKGLGFCVGQAVADCYEVTAGSSGASGNYAYGSVSGRIYIVS